MATLLASDILLFRYPTLSTSIQVQHLKISFDFMQKHQRYVRQCEAITLKKKIGVEMRIGNHLTTRHSSPPPR